VNVSARQLDSDRLVDDLAHALRDSGLEPAALTLEVADAALMRAGDDTARRLERLKQLGVRIAIDGALVHALVRLGRQLEIETPTDGIEDDAHLHDRLLDADEVAAFVAANEGLGHSEPAR
jgi:EAL domain-containing protein (putative c-di-GMP-specific phosphodiesterase class I)